MSELRKAVVKVAHFTAGALGLAFLLSDTLPKILGAGLACLAAVVLGGWALEGGGHE